MRGTGSGTVLALVLGGCAIAPDLPPDVALPIQEILQHTSCELQHAFRTLASDPIYARFKPGQWLVTISLTPKVDTDANASAGFTRKNPFVGNPIRFVTWSFSGPGLQADVKGERTGGVNFTFKSNELMKDKILLCPASPSTHALAQHLGVGEWLVRTASAINIASSADIDKPTYDTDITIKFNGNGSYIYTFPAGTDLAAFGGSYSLDEQLNISMAPIAPKQTLVVVSLPAGQDLKKDGTPPNQVLTSTVSVQSAQQRLDIIQLQQELRRLQTLQTSP